MYSYCYRMYMYVFVGTAENLCFHTDLSLPLAKKTGKKNNFKLLPASLWAKHGCQYYLCWLRFMLIKLIFEKCASQKLKCIDHVVACGFYGMYFPHPKYGCSDNPDWTGPDQRSMLRERYWAQETNILHCWPCSNSTNNAGADCHCRVSGRWAFHEWVCERNRSTCKQSNYRLNFI